MNGTTEAPATEEGRAAGAKGAGGGTEAGPPAWSTVFRAQLRLLLRKKWKLLGLIGLAGLTALFWADPPAATPSTRHFGVAEFAASPFVYGVAVLLAVAWAASVWSDEGPGERAYHWSLPVRRPVHDLTRVGAGGLLFLAAAAPTLAGIYAAHLLLGGGFALGDPALLGLSAGVVAVAYLLGTIPALVADHPLRWAVATVLGYLIIGGLLEEAAERWSWLAGPEAAVKSVWNGAYGLENALMSPSSVFVSRFVEEYSPDPGQAGGALFLWLGLAAAAVVGVSFLHLERAKGAAE